MTVNGKQCNINLIYRSSSQSSEEFDPFLTNVEFYQIISQIETRL